MCLKMLQKRCLRKYLRMFQEKCLRIYHEDIEEVQEIFGISWTRRNKQRRSLKINEVEKENITSRPRMTRAMAKKLEENQKKR
jgi:hypothetical protein